MIHGEFNPQYQRYREKILVGSDLKVRGCSISPTTFLTKKVCGFLLAASAPRANSRLPVHDA